MADEGDAPETNLAISGLIARADDKDGKVLSVNKILKKKRFFLRKESYIYK